MNSYARTVRGRRVVVSGYDSFLGRKICSSLAEGGALVRALVPDGKTMREVQARGCQGWVGDIGFPESLADALVGFPVLIHVITSERGGDTHLDNLVTAAEQQGTSKLVCLSYPEGSTSGRDTRKSIRETLSDCEVPVVHLRTGLVISSDAPFVQILKRSTFFGRVLWPGNLEVQVAPVCLKDLLDIIHKICVTDSDFHGSFPVCGPKELTMRTLLRRIGKSLTGDDVDIYSAPPPVSYLFEHLHTPDVTMFDVSESNLICSSDRIWQMTGVSPSRIEDVLE